MLSPQGEIVSNYPQTYKCLAMLLHLLVDLLGASVPQQVMMSQNQGSLKSVSQRWGWEEWTEANWKVVRLVSCAMSLLIFPFIHCTLRHLHLSIQEMEHRTGNSETLHSYWVCSLWCKIFGWPAGGSGLTYTENCLSKEPLSDCQICHILTLTTVNHVKTGCCSQRGKCYAMQLLG